MIQLSGNNILKLPEVNPLGFVFNSISVLTTGSSSISFANFSGTTGLNFLFSGQNIYIQSSGINKKVSSYNTGENFSISGNILSGNNNFNYLDFYIKDLYINSLFQSLPNNLYLLNINVASGDVLNIDAQMFCNNINYNLNLPNSYNALGSFTGVVNTDTSFWILNSSTIFSQSYQTLLGIDTIIAPVKKNNPLILNISDLDDSSQDYTVGLQSYLTTNIGEIAIGNTIARSGNEENTITNFSLLNTTSNVSGLFDGFWSGNNFVYNDFPEYSVLNFEYSNMNISGVYSTGQNILVKFESFQPLNGQSYTSEYITGFNLTNTGNYLYPPQIVFNNYYYTTGITQAFNSMLFSSGCSGNLPVIFSGAGGSGASGSLLLLPVTLSNLYQTGNAGYYIVTGLLMLNSGTNYTGNPIAVLQTGIYSNCYDVPKHYSSNLYSFKNINASGLLSPQATALTGLVLTNTGVFGSVTGFYVSGLDITNIGYGYNASRMPTCSFVRQAGDNLTQNASGTFLLKSTGSYNINNFWVITTGWTNGNLFPLQSGFSGIFPNTQRFFSINLQCSGLDNTSGIVSKLSVLPSLGSGIIQYITGTKYFDTDPYFLKKKLDAAELLTPISGDLSFLTTQNDLETVYNNYVSNIQGLNIGSLDF